jgi:hypothetical protein
MEPPSDSSCKKVAVRAGTGLALFKNEIEMENPTGDSENFTKYESGVSAEIKAGGPA